MKPTDNENEFNGVGTNSIYLDTISTFLGTNSIYLVEDKFYIVLSLIVR